MSRLALSARSLAGRFIAGRGAVTTARRCFHSGVVTRISFEESRQATAHCHHSTMWKEWKPLAGAAPTSAAFEGLRALARCVTSSLDVLELQRRW